jgi:PadR family transcriptional regulator PadR
MHNSAWEGAYYRSGSVHASHDILQYKMNAQESELGPQTRQSQVLKGLGELALLSLLQERAHYGLEILERLRGEAGVDLAAGTIYPMLYRLEKSDRVRSEWRIDDPDARPRKYYALTGEGRRDLKTQLAEWRRLASVLGRFLDREMKR